MVALWGGAVGAAANDHTDHCQNVGVVTVSDILLLVGRAGVRVCIATPASFSSNMCQVRSAATRRRRTALRTALAASSCNFSLQPSTQRLSALPLSTHSPAANLQTHGGRCTDDSLHRERRPPATLLREASNASCATSEPK